MSQVADGWGEIYRGLKACMELSFPKRCERCGQLFNSLDDFIVLTKPLDDKSGLQELEDMDDELVVGLCRNCSCDSTLMVVCYDRRDQSPAGKEKRIRFDLMIDCLVHRGLDREAARLELRRYLNDGESELLSRQYGLTPGVFHMWFDSVGESQV